MATPAKPIKSRPEREAYIAAMLERFLPKMAADRSETAKDYPVQTNPPQPISALRMSRSGEENA